jgi:hypothetical protein
MNYIQVFCLELMQKLIIADCDEYDESVLLTDDMATCFGETKRKSWIDMYTSVSIVNFDQNTVKCCQFVDVSYRRIVDK